MATEVHGLRDEKDQLLMIEVDGIIVAHMTYAVADKFKGLAPALIKATHEWAKQRDADDAAIGAVQAER